MNGHAQSREDDTKTKERVCAKAAARNAEEICARGDEAYCRNSSPLGKELVSVAVRKKTQETGGNRNTGKYRHCNPREQYQATRRNQHETSGTCGAHIGSDT